MRRIRSKGTLPERTAALLLRELRLRFRRHVDDLPGRPDFSSKKLKTAVFVHGCFWHQHSLCVDGRAPKSNSEYWAPKLVRNQRRDRLAQRQLRKMGWRVLVLWECHLGTTPEAVARKLRRFFS